MNQRTNISSGAPWETIFGYSRAVKVGNQIEVSGTTAVQNGIVVEKGDYYGQTRCILQKINEALIEAGSSLDAITRTRVFVCDISKWEEVARAHAEFFGQIKPASTLVEVTRLIDPEMLVEIEATAVTGPVWQ